MEKRPTTREAYAQGVASERKRVLQILSEIEAAYPLNHTLVGASSYGIGPLAEIKQRVCVGRPLIEVLANETDDGA